MTVPTDATCPRCRKALACPACGGTGWCEAVECRDFYGSGRHLVCRWPCDQCCRCRPCPCCGDGRVDVLACCECQGEGFVGGEG